MRVIYRLSFQYNSKWLYSISLEYFQGFITKQFNDLLPVGLFAQLIRALHPYHRGQEFKSQYKPELFSGFLFATAKVASTTAMILFHVIDFFFIINNFGASYLEVVIIQRSKFKLLLLNSQWMVTLSVKESDSSRFKGKYAWKNLFAMCYTFSLVWYSELWYPCSGKSKGGANFLLKLKLLPLFVETNWAVSQLEIFRIIKTWLLPTDKVNLLLSFLLNNSIHARETLLIFQNCFYNREYMFS